MRDAISLRDLKNMLAEIQVQGGDAPTLNQVSVEIETRVAERLRRRRERRHQDEGSFAGDIGGRLKYGYLRTTQGITVNETAVPIIRRIFALHDSKMSLQAIAKILNDEHVKTSRGKAMWYPSSVREILQNKDAYLGGEIGNTGAKWPPILITTPYAPPPISADRLPWGMTLPTGLPIPVAPRITVIYQIHLQLDDIKPDIWRRLAVPADSTLEGLAYIVCVAMGWPDGLPFSMQSQDDAFVSNMQSEQDTWNATTRLCDIAWEGSRIRFTYDHDKRKWSHSLHIEEQLTPKPRTTYPRIIEGKRACPPLICNSPSMYMKYVRALDHPYTRGSQTLITRFGSSFDPDHFSLREVNGQLREHFPPHQ